MSSLKVLLTGASGFLGQYLAPALESKFNLLALYNENPDNVKGFAARQCDINDADILSEIFETFDPDTIIHTAGVTSALSTLEPGCIYKTNVTATENIAQLCSRHNCRLIFTSTDLVYAGYRGTMIKEDAKLDPRSIYAETKLVAEERIRRITDNYIILRTALLYGNAVNNRSCHFNEMTEDLEKRKHANLFFDQFRTPLYVKDAVEIIAGLNESDLSNVTLNFGGPEKISRTDMGELYCRKRELNPELITRISMRDVPGLPVVEDVSMNTDKLKELGFSARNVSDAVDDFIADKFGGNV